ncbi:hypothetical protein BC830DRAFT_1151211 [Chytriomyces sp. MP71]|nr:hypothetical protein BC830DRAFT_1151211 [Chytriomyces sp. MP71]
MFSMQTADDLPSFENTGDSALQDLKTWFPVTQTLQKNVEQNENKDPADDKGLKSALKLLQDSPCNVFKPAPGNPGFDLVSAPLLAAGKHQKSIRFDTPVTKDCFYLCLELKYSHQLSSTVLKLEEIEKKKNHVDKMFKQAKIDRQPVLVLVAARSFKKGLDLEALPDNVLVILRPELVKLYGASFKSRPLFYLS